MFKRNRKGENLYMKEYESDFNTLQPTQHTMLKKRPCLERIKNALCDQGDWNAIGQIKFEYKEFFKNF